MARYTKTSLGSNYASKQQIDTNLDDIKTAIDDTLSRKGDSPNAMEADLDMNSNQILNLPDAVTGQEPVTLSQVGALIAAVVPEGTVMTFGTTGASATVSGTTFDLNSLFGVTVVSVPEIFINGVQQIEANNYSVAANVVTLDEGVETLDVVVFKIKV